MLTKIRQLYKKSRLSKNTAPKVLSLLCAAILWFYVMNQVNPEVIREIQNVHVKLVGTEEMSNNNLEIMGEVDYFVDVKIKGRRKEAYSLTTENIELIADLRGYDKGMNNVPLRKSINAENITIVELSKPDIKIFLDKIVEITKEVRIDIIGEVPSGYIPGDLVLQPETIIVIGPESVVNNVSGLVGVLDIGDGTSSVTKEIPISPQNNDGEIVMGVTLKSDYVKSDYSISKRKSVPIAKNITGNVANGYKLITSTVTPNNVVIDGEKALINAVSTMRTNPVSIERLKEDFRIEVQLIPENGVRTPFFSGSTVIEGVIEEIISKEFTIDIKDIPTISLNTDFETDISKSAESVVVRINDATSILGEVIKSDIDLFINAGNLKIGENEVELKINVNGTYESVQVIPNKIIINVTNKNENVLNEGIDTSPEVSPEMNESIIEGQSIENESDGEKEATSGIEILLENEIPATAE